MSHATPKRRNAEKTKARILDAARQVFAEQGFPGASIREIAARADINSSLLGRYFGSKAGLFKAALVDSIQVDRLVGVERAEFGRVVALNFLGDDPQLYSPAMTLISAREALPRQIVAEVQQYHVILPLARWLGPPQATERAMRIIILCAGFVIYAKQLHSGEVALHTGNPTVAWFVESVQQIVDQSGCPQ